MHDIIIVGAGPAGMTAAVYARRAGKTVLVLEKESIGGQISSSPKVENWPGSASISGSQLADGMFEQMLALGADFELEEVVDITSSDGCFTVVTADGRHRCRAVIIAAGSKHRHLGLTGEDELSGISYCAVCDGAFYNGKTVAVVGGGSAALQDGIFLSAGCKKVYIIHRRDTFRGEERLVEVLSSRDNVEFVLRSKVTGLVGDGELTGVMVENLEDGTADRLSLDGLFVAIGHEPENRAFEDYAQLNDQGYFAAGENCLTRTAGLFVAGDCRSKEIRQLTTAAADGSVAALAACKFIDNCP